MQGDVGIVGAGGRIGDRYGTALGIGGIGNVPAANPGDVDTRHQQPGPVGRPPVPALTAHLLGGDELREAIGDLVVLRAQQDLRPTAVRPHHMQCPGLDVRDTFAGRIDARIDGAAAGR